MSEIQKIMQGLDNKSSSGDDNLSNVLIKNSALVTEVYLEYLISLSFSTGVFPDELSNAKVCPLYKEGSKVDEKKFYSNIPFKCMEQNFRKSHVQPTIFINLIF